VTAMRLVNSFFVLAAGVGVVSMAQPLPVRSARPLTLASADFDVDGYPELVTGFGTADGGIVQVRRGNPEAFAPADPAVLEGIARGLYPSPFLAAALRLRVPASPDFLAAGDFDRDRNPKPAAAVAKAAAQA